MNTWIAHRPVGVTIAWLAVRSFLPLAAVVAAAELLK
jgi:hypothetical protein